MFRTMIIFTMLILILSITGCKPEQSVEGECLMQKISQFSETEIKYDESLLDDRQRIVVEKLYMAAKIIDGLFLEQVYAKNTEIRNKLLSQSGTQTKNELKYFDIMFGPFDRLDERRPFIGSDDQPLGANFYPEDMTKEEFENWLQQHPGDRESFTSEFTVIRRQNDKLVAIPYSEHYKDKLIKISALLNEAAEYADNSSLKRYLLTRAIALGSERSYN